MNQLYCDLTVTLARLFSLTIAQKVRVRSTVAFL